MSINYSHNCTLHAIFKEMEEVKSMLIDKYFILFRL